MSDLEAGQKTDRGFWTDKLPYPALFSYPVARKIEFRPLGRIWPGWLINIGIFIFVCGIIPVNVITQGYESVSTYEVYHNTTLSHWFDKFSLGPSTTSDCDPHIFSVGDTFVTNIGSFTWTISAANSVYGGLQSGSLNASKIITMGQYSGTSLDWCDVNSMHVAADVVRFQVEVSAVILCYNQDFILANTVVYTGWEDDAWFREKTTNINMPSTWVQVPVQAAAYDLMIQLRNLAAVTNVTQIIEQFAVTTFPTQCPQQYLKDPKGFLATASPLLVSQGTWCTQDDTTRPPALGLEWSLQQVQVYPLNVPVPAYNLFNAVNNTLQTMLAAVRWDLGNLQPNNFLSNTREVLTQNETFFVPFTTATANSGSLFNYLTVSPWNTTGSLTDLQLPATPLFLVPFLCHLSKLKSPGAFFISVLIGTLSICTSAWGILLLISAALYKWRRDDVNYCDAHVIAVTTPRPEAQRGSTTDTVKSELEKKSGQSSTLPLPSPPALGYETKNLDEKV